MNAKEKQLLIQMQNELQKERQCCDMLADALIQGGLDRSFEALTFHELLRNGMQYTGATLGKSRAKRRRNHPTMGYYTYGADQTPFDQDEEQ
jgi:hypothetical protein